MRRTSKSPAVLSLNVLAYIFPLLVNHGSAEWIPESRVGGSCSIKHRELVIPYVSSKQGTLLSYSIPEHDGRSSPKVLLNKTSFTATHPKRLLVTVRWRRQILTLVLHKTWLTDGRSSIEWVEQNITYFRQFTDDCYYQGRISKVPGSYAALGTCKGLEGFIRTSDEDLFIQPMETTVHEKGRAHFIYACKASTSAPANISDTRRTDEADGGGSPGEISHGPEEPETRTGRWRRSKATHFFLEVLLVADRSLTDFHGKENLQQYLLAMMNIWNAVYQHPSLGERIEVVLKRVVILEKKVSEDIITENNAQSTLDEFCRWASLVHRKNQGKEHNHDIAILLTRTKIGPAGFAPVTGMCQPHRSCSIIKEDGLSTAFIVAHEAAHIFGLQHDGQGNQCHGSEYKGTIMAPMVESSFDMYYWSECSRQQMKYVINSFTCLRNNPKRGAWPTVPTPMGIKWSLDEQCLQEFGKEFSHCGTFDQDPCSQLWCKDRNNYLLCRTKHGSPLSGTKCEYGKWCQDGRCEYTSTLYPIHGGWSSWSRWGECSITCGVGASFRQRRCDSPSPAFGGKECVGPFEEFRLCRNKPCSQDNDMRAEQCSNFDGMLIINTQHTWLPYQTHNASTYCKLTCVSKETGDILMTEADVLDGTPCTYEEPYNICARGVCKKIGCNAVLYSEKKMDICGNCGGDNSGCKTIHGNFTESSWKETNKYHRILVLPKGARNIEIAETESSPNFIAVKDAHQNEFHLNGKSKQGGSKEFIANGAHFIYSRSGQSESLVSRGPLNKELVVMLFRNKDRKDSPITYQYTANKDDFTFEKYNFQWTFVKWSECSVSCGSGTKSGPGSEVADFRTLLKKVAPPPARFRHQSTIYACTQISTNKEVDQTKCERLKPARIDSVRCEREQCMDASWELDDWGGCSTSCGKNGLMVKVAFCVAMEKEEKKYLSDDFCKEKSPQVSRACNRKPCPGKWKAGGWSECSETCGRGIQMRHVYCSHPEDGEDYKCYQKQPASSQECKEKACPVEAKKDCIEDISKFCIYGTSARTCTYSGFKTICCKSCEELANRSNV